jgi:hypothetical protein
VTALLLVAGAAAAQKVKTTDNGNFDFATYKRDARAKNHIITRQGRQNDALIDAKIVQDVNQILAQKGFIEDPANPDSLITYVCNSLLVVTDRSDFRTGSNFTVTHNWECFLQAPNRKEFEQ